MATKAKLKSVVLDQFHGGMGRRQIRNLRFFAALAKSNKALEIRGYTPAAFGRILLVQRQTDVKSPASKSPWQVF